MRMRRGAVLALLGLLLALLAPSAPAHAGATGARQTVTGATSAPDAVVTVRTSHREHLPLPPSQDADAPTGALLVTDENDGDPSEVTPPLPSASVRTTRVRGPPQG